MTFRADTASRVAVAISFDVIYDFIEEATWKFIEHAKVSYEGHRNFFFNLTYPLFCFLMDMREFVLEGRIYH